MSDEFQTKFYFDSEETELQFNSTKSKEEKFNIEYYIDYLQNNLTKFNSYERE